MFADYFGLFVSSFQSGYYSVDFQALVDYARAWLVTKED